MVTVPLGATGCRCGCVPCAGWLLHPLVWTALGIAALRDQLPGGSVGRWRAAQHPGAGTAEPETEARPTPSAGHCRVCGKARIQRAYPRPPGSVHGGGEGAGHFSAADLLLFVISVSGRYGGDRVPPPDRWGMDEPLQSGVWGPSLRCVGSGAGYGYRAAAAESGKSDCYLFAFGTVLGGVYEYVCAAPLPSCCSAPCSGIKQQVQVQSGRAHQPAVLLFWGIAAVLWMRYGYPLVLEADECAARSHIRPWMSSNVGGVRGGEYVYQLAVGIGAVRCPHQRRSAQRTAGSVLDEHFDNARMERIYPNAKK